MVFAYVMCGGIFYCICSLVLKMVHLPTLFGMMSSFGCDHYAGIRVLPGIFFFDLIPKVGKSDIDIRASPYLLRGYEITYNHSSCMGQNSSTPVGMGLSETNIPLKGNHIVPT